MHDRSKQHGMSLLEVILAIAVAGFVLTAAISLLVSISSIWSERSERHFFADHVDGVCEFLNATFATAGSEITSTNIDSRSDDEIIEDPNDSPEPVDPEEEITEDSAAEQPHSGSLISHANEPVRWATPPGFANYQEPLLNFSINDAPPILVGLENAPSLSIDAFLHFKADEGISLLWYSNLQEDVENTNDLRRTLLSPLVKKVSYIYWDERFEGWEEEDSPQRGDDADQYILPRFIKLLFEYEGETKERILTIPVPSRSAFTF